MTEKITRREMISGSVVAAAGLIVPVREVCENIKGLPVIDMRVENGRACCRAEIINAKELFNGVEWIEVNSSKNASYHFSPAVSRSIIAWLPREFAFRNDNYDTIYGEIGFSQYHYFSKPNIVNYFQQTGESIVISSPVFSGSIIQEMTQEEKDFFVTKFGNKSLVNKLIHLLENRYISPEEAVNALRGAANKKIDRDNLILKLRNCESASIDAILKSVSME